MTRVSESVYLPLFKMLRETLKWGPPTGGSEKRLPQRRGWKENHEGGWWEEAVNRFYDLLAYG